jgi:hypothetical protein
VDVKATQFKRVVVAQPNVWRCKAETLAGRAADPHRPHPCNCTRTRCEIHLRHSFIYILVTRLASSRCNAVRAAQNPQRRTPMAASTPGRVSATPPPAQPAAPSKGRLKKPSAKVIEAQHSLRKRTATTAPRPTQDELLPFPTASVSVSPERERINTSLEEVAVLIANLKETIAQQNSVITNQSSIITNQSSIIESVRADLAEIKSEQRSLKTQNAELQEVIHTLRTQLDTLSASPPSTQSWASVAASGDAAGSGTTLSRATSTRKPNKEPNRQLVIDVSRAGEEVAEKVANTEVAKQTIMQGISDVERLTGTTIKDFRVWRANDSASVIRFSVEKDKEAAFRQTTAQWLEPHIPRARLVGPKWHAVKADWVEVPLAMDIDSGKVSKSAIPSCLSSLS